MKRFSMNLTVIAIVVAIVSAFITEFKKINPGFTVYGNINQEASLTTQEDFSSQGEVVATKLTEYTSQELNALAQEHCPGPNNISCLGEVNTVDVIQDPSTADNPPIKTRAGTYE